MRRRTSDNGRRSSLRRQQTTDRGRRSLISRLVVAAIAFTLLAVLSACARATSSDANTMRASQTTTVELASPTPSPAPSETPPPPTPIPTLLPPTPTPCPPELCNYPGHFLLIRPIAAEFTDVVDPTYRYGSSLNGTRKTHHGVEFVNPQGTPVLAAADGVVIVAGNDFQQPYADFPGFYGNLVILEHQVTVASEAVTLYTLYGHLSKVLAEVGQTVSAGDVIGEVGFTGWATGEHLHFEVRLGENSFRKTRNPELWLQPHTAENGEPHGMIAGQVLTEYGTNAYIPTITIEQLDPAGGDPLAIYYLESYADWTVNGDDILDENFAIGDLPAGRYRVSFITYGLHTYEVDVLPGRITMIRFDPRK